MFKGSFVALVTPFKNGNLDESSLRKLVRMHLGSGTSGLVPCGSTGEAATLSPEEYIRTIQIAVEEAAGKIPVVCGVGTNSTAKTLEMVRKVESLGVDGLLVIVPYYNKPTQEGLSQHFSAVSKATRKPLIVYNIPGRTGVNLLPATLARLAQGHKNIVGVKEASGNLDQVSEIRTLTPPGFCILSGDDSLTLPMLSVGAQGVISVAANICPKEVSQMCNAFEKGDLRKAQKIHLKIFPLIKALFIETNPIPIKTAMGILNMISPELRLPLTSMSKQNKEAIRKALSQIRLMR